MRCGRAWRPSRRPPVRGGRAARRAGRGRWRWQGQTSGAFVKAGRPARWRSWFSSPPARTMSIRNPGTGSQASSLPSGATSAGRTMSMAMRSPSRKTVASAQVRSSRPRLKALRKYRPLYDGAITAATPNCTSTAAACSRDEPMPKLAPATITSPPPPNRQGRGGARPGGGADAEVGAGHDHVTRAHLAREFGADALQAVPGDGVGAVLHRVAGRERVGVDVDAQAPDAVAAGGIHASTSRGSVTWPRSAAAATVYGEPR